MDIKRLLNTLLRSIEIREEIWSNGSIGSAFSSRTVNADLSKYDAVEIFYRNSTGTDDASKSIQSVKCHIGEYIGLTGLGSTQSQRIAQVTSSGVSFGNGTYANAYGGSQNIANTVIIPTKIYGLKKLGGVVKLLKSLLCQEVAYEY